MGQHTLVAMTQRSGLVVHVLAMNMCLSPALSFMKASILPSIVLASKPATQALLCQP